MLKNSLNNLNFKILVIFPLIGNILISTLLFFAIKNNWNFKEADNIGYIGALIINIIIFIRDLKTLKEENAHAPSKIWFLIIPIYIFLRQEKNKLNKWYVVLNVSCYVLVAILIPIEEEILKRIA